MRNLTTTLLGVTAVWMLACAGVGGDTDPALDTDAVDAVAEGAQDAEEDGPSEEEERPSGRRGTSRSDGTQPASGGEQAGGGRSGGGSTSGGGSPSAGGGGADPGPPPSWLTDQGNNTWKVPRSKVDGWINNPSALGNARPKGGGYELRGIRSGTDGWWLGMRNGDVVKKVNGYSLGSQAEALIAFAAVQNASKIEVRVKRDGSGRMHTYVIAD